MTTAPEDGQLSAYLKKGGLRERHLDLLLAEEMAVNPSFVRWVPEGAYRDLKDGQREHLALPAGAPAHVSTTVSFWDSSGQPGAAGETDVLVRLEWEDGVAVGLFIEDKLDAVFQPWQGRAVRSPSSRCSHSHRYGAGRTTNLRRARRIECLIRQGPPDGGHRRLVSG